MKPAAILFICLLLTALPGFSQGSGNTPSKPDSPVSLRIMTYNIHHANPPGRTDGFIDLPAIAKVINDAQVDLVALQEVDVNTERSGKGINQARELAALTGMSFVFAKAIDHQGGDYGVAILSRFPIEDTLNYPLPLPAGIKGEPRVLAAAKVTVKNGTKIWIASTHLDLKEETRVFQSDLIIQRFSKLQDDIVLAGDFNAVPESKVIRLLDTHFNRTCLTDCEPTSPNIRPKRTIDFIMYSKSGRIKTKSNEVVQEKYASDHLPVVAELLID